MADTTLPRLGDLQSGATGVRNQHCKPVHGTLIYMYKRVHILVMNVSLTVYTCIYVHAHFILSACFTASCIVVPLADCSAIYNSRLTISGLYYINPGGDGDFLVYCDMSKLDGVDNGWTVIQRRVNNSVDFNKYWEDYAIGFGDLDGNFWLHGSEKNQLYIQNRYRTNHRLIHFGHSFPTSKRK